MGVVHLRFVSRIYCLGCTRKHTIPGTPHRQSAVGRSRQFFYIIL